MAKIKAFIFDLDGTLLNSDKAQIEAAIWVLNKHGISRSFQDVLKYFHEPTDDMMRLSAGDAFKEDPKILGKEHTEKLLELIPSIPLYANVENLFHKIITHGGNIVFASNNYSKIIDAIIKNFKWDKFTAGYIGIDDVKRRKPHPEMVNKAMELLRGTPEDSVIIGDSLYDIQAGKAAGTRTIAVCTGNNKAEDFANLKPDFIFKEVGELIEHIPLRFE